LKFFTPSIVLESYDIFSRSFFVNELQGYIVQVI